MVQQIRTVNSQQIKPKQPGMLLNPMRTINFLLNIRGNFVKNPQTLADTFNNYFTNVAKELVSKITKRDNSNCSQGSYMQYLDQALPQSFPAIHMKAVTEKEIYVIQKGLKWKRSSGYDEVPSWIVKLSMPFISSPLIYICNKILSTGVFPTRLKFSQISPMFKTGDKTDMSAYRPISLLTSFSKLFENVIYNRLLQHTKENSIITMDQYGFKSNSQLNWLYLN